MSVDRHPSVKSPGKCLPPDACQQTSARMTVDRHLWMTVDRHLADGRRPARPRDRSSGGLSQRLCLGDLGRAVVGRMPIGLASVDRPRPDDRPARANWLRFRRLALGRERPERWRQRLARWTVESCQWPVGITPPDRVRGWFPRALPEGPS